MAPNDEDVENDRLMPRPAALTGRPITVAAREGVQAGPAQEQVQPVASDAGQRARLLDPRGPEEILGFDDDGLPS